MEVTEGETTIQCSNNIQSKFQSHLEQSLILKDLFQNEVGIVIHFLLDET